MTGDASALSRGETARIIEELGQLGGIGVKPFALGRERAATPDRLHGLERLGEKVARGLRPVFESLAQARTDVSVERPVICRYDDWAAAQPGFTSVSAYRLKPLKGGMILSVEPGFVCALLERFYGGASGEVTVARREFSAGEELMLDRLVGRVVRVVVEQWNDIATVEASLAERDTSPTQLSFLRPDEAVVVQSFRVAPLECAPTIMSIVYPLSFVRPLEEQMGVRVDDSEDKPVADASWRGRLAHALCDVELPVRSILAQPEITLGQLMALKPGDVIPIQLGQSTPLLVANQAIAQGQIGERDGRAAMLIDHIKRS